MSSTGGRDPGDSLRGLTASGPSKVGVDKAMRVRDVSRPRTEEDNEPDPKTDPDTDERPQIIGGSGVGGSDSGGRSPDSS